MNDPKENETNNPKFKLIIDKITKLFEGNITKYIESNQENKNVITNEIIDLILYLYIIIFNIKIPEKLTLLFNINSSALLNLLKKLLEMSKDIDENKSSKQYIKLPSFILNICFDDMKNKLIYSEDEELKKLYQKNIYCSLLTIFPSANDRFIPTNQYIDFEKDILELKLDNYLYDLKGENSKIFCRNLLPILLTNKKFDFISFYKYVVQKHIEMVRKNYNNELTSLFRADDFINDLIKTLIMLFGNESFMFSFYFTLPKEYLSVNDIEFNLDVFENFLHKFLQKLIETLPYIVRVLLKIVYTCVKELDKSDDDCYNVLYNILIFNFFISPATLNLFDISIVKYKSLRQLTRVIRNIFFGKEFDVKDKLNNFNEKVKIFHKYINDQFNLILDGIDIEKDKIEINKKVSELLVSSENYNEIIKEEKNQIFLPTFCNLYYWENILKVIKDLSNQK
jgi:hypothetical protein